MFCNSEWFFISRLSFSHQRDIWKSLFASSTDPIVFYHCWLAAHEFDWLCANKSFAKQCKSHNTNCNAFHTYMPSSGSEVQTVVLPADVPRVIVASRSRKMWTTIPLWSLQVSLRERSVDASERSRYPSENALWTPVNADPSIHKKTLCERQ